MDTIVNWLAAKIDKKSSVLDLGCGNGILLIQLVFSQIFRIYKFLKFLALKIFPSYPLGFFLLFYEAWIWKKLFFKISIFLDFNLIF